MGTHQERDFIVHNLPNHPNRRVRRKRFRAEVRRDSGTAGSSGSSIERRDGPEVRREQVGCGGCGGCCYGLRPRHQLPGGTAGAVRCC